jgi:coenzyme F420 biosynthesis associated uncharacterized protein
MNFNLDRWLWMAGGASAAVGAGVGWWSRREPPGLVNWDLARRVAVGMSRRDAPPTDSPRDVDYAAISTECRVAVSNYFRREIDRDGAGVVAIDRAAWIEINIHNFGKMLEPIEASYSELKQRSGVGGFLISAPARLAVSLQMGFMLGFLSARVLGQYDIPLLEAGEGNTYLVDPNIEAVARKARVDPISMRRWVALHEITHALEFESTPWLRGYMAGLLREYLAEIAKTVGDPGSLRTRATEKRADEPKSGLREGKLLGMLLSPRQREIVGSIQAVMSLMEGYSNHAMRNTGAGLIPGYAALDRRMRRREQSRGLAFNVFARLLGLEMKLAQYRLGERFVNQIVERGGIDLLNRAWDSPEALPTLDEIELPEDWIQRINAGA